jgi:hypothetical protein
VADPDQPGPLISHRGERGHVHLAVPVAGHHGHFGAGALGGLPVGQHVWMRAQERLSFRRQMTGRLVSW